MNNEKNMGKRIKELLARKTLPTVLAGTMLFGSGALSKEALAYSLESPNQSYEDFIKYDGIKVFINGRYVEFNESTGYPFVMDSSTMIPLRAVNEAFGGLLIWNDITQTITVGKYDKEVDFTIGKDEIKVTDDRSGKVSINSINTKPLIKDGIIYIPLRSLFECFDLNVRWDSEKKQAHIETTDFNSFTNIDFKNTNVKDINEVNFNNIHEIYYDGVLVDKDYINILKNSNQYKVVINGDKAQIFSYLFLSNLNYIYEIDKNKDDKLKGINKDKVYLRHSLESDEKFFRRVGDATDCMLRVVTSRNIGQKKNNASNNDIISDYEISFYTNVVAEYPEISLVAKDIAMKARNSSNNELDQVKKAIEIIRTSISYDYSNRFRNDAYGALIQKCTKCTGYSRAFQLVMEELGVTSIFVGGINKNSGMSHAWNNVFINGEWYCVNVTHTSDIILLNENYGYVCDNIEEIDLIKLTYKFN